MPWRLVDRFHLVIDVLDRTQCADPRATALRTAMEEARRRHTRYIDEHGEDMPEIRNWRWPR